MKGSKTSTPVGTQYDTNGNLIGGYCTVGSYCPKGSVTPTACGPGKFSATTGNTNSSQCNTCTPGYYCPNASLSHPIICPAGYYCPLGTSSYTLQCRPGFMCPQGSYEETVKFNCNSCNNHLTFECRNVRLEHFSQAAGSRTALLAPVDSIV